MTIGIFINLLLLVIISTFMFFGFKALWKDFKYYQEWTKRDDLAEKYKRYGCDND